MGPGTGVRVYLACGVTDMRKGIAGLAALAAAAALRWEWLVALSLVNYRIRR